MDVSGFIFGQVPRMVACYRIIDNRDFRLCLRPRVVDAGYCGFRDDEHLQYYKSGCGRPWARCEVKKTKEKEKEKDSTHKKRLKLLKGLTRDLSTFSGMDHTHTFSQPQGNTISETAEMLLKQVQLLRAKEKELKKKRKQDKARLKASQRMALESESSSSESSDSEWEPVIVMRNEAAAAARPGTFTQEESTASTLSPQELNDADCNSSCDRGEESCARPNGKYSGTVDCQLRNASAALAVETTQGKRIEVCMGGKCKKSGGAALLEEFGRVMGVEGAAVGCKCMGKCRDGPNVRMILNGIQAEPSSVRIHPPNPLCIGVGLEDVEVIVSNFFGQEGKVLGLGPSS